jgi:hypothetical protein
MTLLTHPLSDLEPTAEAGRALNRAEAERVLATADLVSVGSLADIARRRRAGEIVTFGRVALGPATPAEGGAFGEVRLAIPWTSYDAAADLARAAALSAASAPVTGFSLAELLAESGGDLGALERLATKLRRAGLEAVSEIPIDRFPSADALGGAVRAVRRGGLGAWRLTIDRAPLAARLGLVERAAALQEAVGDIRAFAPLPRLDAADVPSTGYDDVRTVAVASLVCPAIPFWCRASSRRPKS